MIQFHSAPLVRASARTAKSVRGNYAAYGTPDGAYVNGPAGYLRQFFGVDAMAQAIAHLSTLGA